MGNPASLTTPSGWSAAIVRALDAAGVDGRRIAASAGIEPDLLDDPNARVPRGALTNLWHAAVAATGDESFGLTAVKFATQTTLHALGVAVLASETAREALERMIRFRRVIGAVNQVRLEEAAERYRFVIDVSAPPGVPFVAVDAFAAGIVRQLRALTGDRTLAPLAVYLERPAPADAAPFVAMFRTPVTFEADANVLEFAKDVLDRRLPTANAEIAAQNDRVVLEYLTRVESERLASRVERELIEALPDGVPAQEDLARRLGVSSRGLQRRLAAEGTTWREILDSAREALARDYVRAGTLSITEIASRLGFSETSAFSRAFKRWTGVAPRSFARTERTHTARSPRSRH